MVSDYKCVTGAHVAPSRKASDESTSIRNSGDAYAERATIPTLGFAVFSHIDESLPCIPDCSCPAGLSPSESASNHSGNEAHSLSCCNRSCLCLPHQESKPFFSGLIDTMADVVVF